MAQIYPVIFFNSCYNFSKLRFLKEKFIGHYVLLRWVISIYTNLVWSVLKAIFAINNHEWYIDIMTSTNKQILKGFHKIIVIKLNI